MMHNSFSFSAGTAFAPAAAPMLLFPAPAPIPIPTPNPSPEGLDSLVGFRALGRGTGLGFCGFGGVGGG